MLTRSTLSPEYHPFLGVGMWDPVCSQPSSPPPLQLWLYFLYFASQYVDTWPFHKSKITSVTMSATSCRAIIEVHTQGWSPWSMKQVWLQQISLNNSFSIKSLLWNKDTLLNSETPSINCQSLRVHWTVSLLPSATTEHTKLVELFDPLLADNKDSSHMTLTVQDWDKYGKILWNKILCL